LIFQVETCYTSFIDHSLILLLFKITIRLMESLCGIYMDLTNLIVILKSGRMYGTSRVLLLFKIASRFVKLLCGIHMDPTNPIIILKKLKNKRRLMLPPMTQLLTLFSFFFIIKQKITKPCKWVEV
jgi:hypothetical protein